MTAFTVLNEAHDALRSVVAGTAESDWKLPTPCSEWTAAQVLQHAAGDQLAFAAFITGGEGPSDTPFAPSGELAEAPLSIIETAISASAAAWATVDKEAAAVAVPVPPNEMSAEIGAAACALDAAVHAWDIAMATGRPSPLTPGMAGPLLETAKHFVEPLRSYGAYAAAVAGEQGDDEVAALLRYLGRDPRWTA